MHLIIPVNAIIKSNTWLVRNESAISTAIMFTRSSPKKVPMSVIQNTSLGAFIKRLMSGVVTAAIIKPPATIVIAAGIVISTGGFSVIDKSTNILT